MTTAWAEPSAWTHAAFRKRCARFTTPARWPMSYWASTETDKAGREDRAVVRCSLFRDGFRERIRQHSQYRRVFPQPLLANLVERISRGVMVRIVGPVIRQQAEARHELIQVAQHGWRFSHHSAAEKCKLWSQHAQFF